MLSAYFVYDDLKYLLPEIFLFFYLMYLIIFSAIYSNIFKYRLNKLTRLIVANTVLAVLYYDSLLFNSIEYNNTISLYSFINNYITLTLKILLSITFIIIIISSVSYLEMKQIYFYEFHLILFISFFATIILIMSFDLILIYLCIELQSLCFYILIAINKVENKSIEASLKYFILGSFSSSLLASGVGIIYGITGLTNLKDLYAFLSIETNPILINYFFFLGVMLINIGFYFKLAIVPFHVWLPDIYEGSTKVIIFVFSTIPKIGLIYVYMNIYSNILINILIDWESLFNILIILSWLISILGALKAKKIKKLLAYSSINHMGFLLLIINLNNIELMLLYLIIYLNIIINIFVILLSLIVLDSKKKNRNSNMNSSIDEISHLSYLLKNNPFLIFSLAIFLFSLAGIPPLAGFYGKFFIFFAAVKLNWVFICLIGLIVSIISCFYYLRLIKLLIFNNNNNWFIIKNPNWFTRYLISISLIFNIFFPVFLPFLTDLCHYIVSMSIT